MSITSSLRFLAATTRHKREVYRAGRRLGVGHWQLLIHDLSKYRPSEFVPYGLYFYALPGATRHKAVIDKSRDRAMRTAWLRHIQRNAHHWQYHLVWRPECRDHSRLPSRPVASVASPGSASYSGMAAGSGIDAQPVTSRTSETTSLRTGTDIRNTTEHGTPQIDPHNASGQRIRSVGHVSSFSGTTAMDQCSVPVVERGTSNFLPSTTRTGAERSTAERSLHQVDSHSQDTELTDGPSKTDSPICSGCSATTAIARSGSTGTVPIRLTSILVNGASIVAVRRHGQTVMSSPAECLLCQREITGGIEALPMPEKYVREMVADWMGAARAYDGAWPGSLDTWAWWQNNRDHLVLHDDTWVLLADAIIDWFGIESARPLSRAQRVDFVRNGRIVRAA